MSDEKFWGLLLAIVATIGGGIYAYYALQECTRVHPLWYCLA